MKKFTNFRAPDVLNFIKKFKTEELFNNGRISVRKLAMPFSVVGGERGVSRYNQIKMNLILSTSQHISSPSNTLSESEADLSFLCAWCQ